MGRIAITDFEEAIAGWDQNMGTFFYHSDEEDKRGIPLYMIGARPNEFPSLRGLASALEAHYSAKLGRPVKLSEESRFELANDAAETWEKLIKKGEIKETYETLWNRHIKP